jgi:hypothetical protein
MINMIKLGFTPKACCWVHRRGQAQGILAVYVHTIFPVGYYSALFILGLSARNGIQVPSGFMMVAETANH